MRPSQVGKWASDPLGALWGVIVAAVHREAQSVLLVLLVASGLCALVASVGPSRRLAARLGQRLWLKLRWRRAVHHAGLATNNGSVPRPRRIREVPAGHGMQVVIPNGSHAGALEASAETVAACLGVREVRVVRDPANAARAQVTVVRRDPLSGGPPLAWELLSAPRVLLWDPVPVGVGEDGQVVSVTLPYFNLLLGGEPGGGKSGILNLLIAAAALDPDVSITLFDGKWGVEFAVWQRCAQRFVTGGVEEAIEVLGGMRSEMRDRYLHLRTGRARKVGRGGTRPLHLVVVDELAEFSAPQDRKAGTEFSGLMRDLVSKGRAAGIIVLAATQKPSADIVPTALRDLFAFRWALRCTTPQASDTILGSGWASQGYSSARIDAADRGVGLLLHEGGVPVRLRAAYLSDSDLGVIAARAEALRRAGREPCGVSADREEATL